MNTRTRPERNLETLEHEPEKCDWKTTDTQKMRSRKCRTGPSVCGKRPPNSSIYVSTSEVKTTTEGITTLSSAGLPAWESAGCQPHRKTPRSRKFNSTENMKTTSETETLQQHGRQEKLTVRNKPAESKQCRFCLNLSLAFPPAKLRNLEKRRARARHFLNL